MSQKEKTKLKIHNVEQGSEEWFALRLKYPLTASNAQTIATGSKGLETLIWEQLAQKFSGKRKESYSGPDIERGKELESEASDLYELETGSKIEKIGFVTNSKISDIGGASPDGKIKGKKAGIEIKCPKAEKHLKMIIDHKKNGTFKIETQYIWQMQMQMLFAEWEYIDFVSFNPDFKESLLIQRVYADKAKQEKIILGLSIGGKIINEITQIYEQHNN